MDQSGPMQPYRRGAREAGPALTAMLRGRTVYGFNPADLERGMQRMARASKRSGRQPRAPRKPRSPR